MVASEDKLGAHIWLVLAILLETMPAQLLQPLCQTHLQRFLLITERMNLRIGSNLKVEILPCNVIVIGWIQVLLIKPFLAPTTLVLVCLLTNYEEGS